MCHIVQMYVHIYIWHVLNYYAYAFLWLTDHEKLCINKCTYISMYVSNYSTSATHNTEANWICTFCYVCTFSSSSSLHMYEVHSYHITSVITYNGYRVVVLIIVSHWSFSNQFPHWAKHSFWSAKLIVCIFSLGWQSITYKISYLQKMSDKFLTLISTSG